MKKIIYLTLASFFFFQKTEAQTFTVIGSDSLIENVSANNITIHDIFLQNQTAGDDTLGYQVTQLGLMNGWDASLCVNGNCQIGVPLAAGVMAPIPTTQQGLMGFNVNPYFQSGTSFLIVKVWDIHDTMSKATLYWQLTLQPNSVNGELGMTNDELKLFPNPATYNLQLSTYDLKIGDAVKILDLNGRIVSDEIISSSENAIDVSDLNCGIYFLEIKNSAGEISRGKFIKQ